MRYFGIFDGYCRQLHSARDLSKTGWGRSDPYCRGLVNGVDVGRTPTRQRTQSPEWMATIQLRGLRPVSAPQQTLSACQTLTVAAV